jgi:hypothetical protein
MKPVIQCHASLFHTGSVVINNLFYRRPKSLLMIIVFYHGAALVPVGMVIDAWR